MGASKIHLTVLLAALALGCDGGDGGGAFTCPHGENPDGNGCFVPCSGGWQEDADGSCHVSCPAGSAADGHGRCTVQQCPDGWTPVALENAGWGTAPTCARECPDGMTWEASGSWACVVPCAEGWSAGGDGLCHRDCLEGMTPTGDGAGCALASVGESKTCPDGPFDESIAGPGPIYVDAEEGSDATGDGSAAAPFASVAAALDAAGDSATVYLAAGTYAEQILAEEITELNLIGACAEQVLIAPPTLPDSLYEYTPGAVQTYDVDNVRVHGVSVQSPKTALRLEHLATDGSPGAVRVDQVHVVGAGLSGFAVWGAFDEIAVEDCTVEGALEGMGLTGDELSGLPAGQVTVRRSLVRDLIDPTSVDYLLGNGIIVIDAGSLALEDVEVTGLTHAAAFNAQVVEQLGATRLLVHDIGGSVGLRYVAGAANGAVTVTDSVFADLVPEATLLDPNGESFAALQSGGERDAITLRGNRFERVTGFGASILTGAEGTVEIAENEFLDSSGGLWLGGGATTVTDNRFQRVYGAMIVSDDPDAGWELGEVRIEDNTFAERAESDLGMPAGGPKEILATAFAVSLLEVPRPVTFAGNTFYDIGAAAGDDFTPSAILALDCARLSLEGNHLARVAGAGLHTDGGIVEVRDSSFAEVTEAIVVVGGPTDSLEELTIADNYLQGSSAVYVAWQQEAGEIVLTGNRSLEGESVIGLPQLAVGGAAACTVAGNQVVSAGLSLSQCDELVVEDNLLEGVSLEIVDQGAGAETDVRRNALAFSSISVGGAAGPCRIADNGLGGAGLRPVGIAVYGSEGPVVVDHNLIDAVSAAELEGVGQVGDGVHVVGDPEGVASTVEITNNRVTSNERLGVLLHDATGLVEGNMYVDNGCGTECDLVVQSPAGDGVGGYDTGFAVEPVSPYGVIAPEDGTVY